VEGLSVGQVVVIIVVSLGSAALGAGGVVAALYQRFVTLRQFETWAKDRKDHETWVRDEIVVIAKSRGAGG